MEVKKMMNTNRKLLVPLAVIVGILILQAVPYAEDKTNMERKGAITFKGNEMTLVGPEVKVGDSAPDFTAVNTALEPVKLSDFKGQVVVITTVPSLDTGVCEAMTRKFNEEAAKLDAKVLTISMDLPFAQKRFCGAHGIDAVTTLSDYKDHDFAEKYGLMIKELGLLARSVMVVNQEGKIVYQELVPEVTNEPDYEKAIEAVKNL
jgi:thiol peroxidase